jgi:hypothetical protein
VTRSAPVAIGAAVAAAALALLTGGRDAGSAAAAAAVPPGYAVVDSARDVGGFAVWLDVRTPSGARVQLGQTAAATVDANPMLRGLLPGCAPLETARWRAPRVLDACGARLAGVRVDGVTRIVVGEAPRAELLRLAAGAR